MTPIQLIALDLDGTLLQPDHSISPRCKRAIDAAIKAGCRVVPATGRPLAGIPAELLQTPHIDYAVTANGATVFHGQQPILKLWISRDDFFLAREITQPFDCVMDMFVLGKAYNSGYMLARVEQWAPPGTASYILSRSNPVDDMIELARKQPGMEKFNMYFTNELQREQARQVLAITGKFEVTSSAVTNLEVNAKGVHKGRGVLALAQRLGVDASQILACGDADNDTELLKAVGVGVAMGNAEPGVKQVADWVSPPNTHDGVAHAIEKYVLEPRGIFLQQESHP